MYADTLPDILNRPETKSHIRAMYKIGAVMLQESAFAAYSNSDNADITISDLVVPKIKPGDFQDVARQSNSISAHDVYKLIRTPGYENDIGQTLPDDTATFYGELTLEAYRHLEPKIQARVERTMANLDYSLSERIDAANRLINSVEERLRWDQSTRRDIELFTHNHPQHPATHAKPEYLVSPSLTDITTYLQLRPYSPSHTAMIVGSDGENHAALVYRAIVNTPHLVDYSEELSEKPKNQLIVAGFAIATLLLRNNGSVHKSSLPTLKEFTATNLQQ